MSTGRRAEIGGKGNFKFTNEQRGYSCVTRSVGFCTVTQTQNSQSLIFSPPPQIIQNTATEKHTTTTPLKSVPFIFTLYTQIKVTLSL
jgi:hypothetical protein